MSRMSWKKDDDGKLVKFINFSMNKKSIVNNILVL
jgi:hypothetical protein